MTTYTRVTCPCGAGKVSAYDGKCGHCRTKKEKKAHQWKLANGLYRDPDGELAYMVRTGNF